MTIKKPKSKGERSRSFILESAEHHFAKYGYNATRLEDVAEDAGYTRPGLFYHFPDKPTLYQATLKNAFGNLASEFETALMGPGTIAERFERAMKVLIESIVVSPTLGRLILRYVADAEEQPTTGTIYEDSNQLILTAWELFNQGCENGELKPRHNDPVHTASMVVGSSVFYSATLKVLIPLSDFDPSSPERVAAHTEETLGVVRYLLGIPDPSKKTR
ncbi:TetR/AcrR family transcriptional regulator [Ketobacter sp.]